MTETTVSNRKPLYKQLFSFLVKINLFDENEDFSLVDQLLSTRIFVTLFTISLTTIIIFSGSRLQTHTTTIESPSIHTFLKLSGQYRNTLSCPCQQSSIRQGEFLSFSPEYHPICSSQFLNETFLSSLSDMNMSNYWPLDYRTMISSHCKLLSLLCKSINQVVVDALQEFANEYLISNQILLPDAFDAQITALLNRLVSTTISTNKYTTDFLWSNILQNGIYSGLRSNYFVQATPGILSSYSQVGYKTLTGRCYCSENVTCVYQAGIYNRTGRGIINSKHIFGELIPDPTLLFNISGIMVGCLPFNSLLRSTLQCFYNQSCLNLLQIYIYKLSFVLPLSSSSSRFKENLTVNDLLDQLLIESWNNISNFTNYFQICSPQSCTYSYYQRFDLLYIIVTIISLFGGLKIILFFSTPFIIKLIRKIQKTSCCQKPTDQRTIDIQTELKPSKALSFSTISRN